MKQNTLTAEQVIEALGLVPETVEGGLYRSTYRSAAKTYDGKTAGSAIFYMLRGDAFSHLHKLSSDEMYHFYLGDPVELVELTPDGECKKTVLGSDLAGGESLQYLVPAGNWQGSCLAESGKWALLGTTVWPGFSREGYEHADAETLLGLYPSARKEILRLTGKRIKS